MQTLFENQFYQDELPFDGDDFIGELEHIKIQDDWEFDTSHGVITACFCRVATLYKIKYNVNVEGYGPTNLFIDFKSGKPDAILHNDVFSISPLIQDKEDIGKDRGTVNFNHNHEGVIIPHDLMVDAYNRIKMSNFN